MLQRHQITTHTNSTETTQLTQHMAGFAKTHQGGMALHYEGHKYFKIREGRDGLFWRCSLHKTGCMAKATSEGTSVIVRQEHNHLTGEEALQVEKAISNMRQRAREETIPVTQIFDQAQHSKATRSKLIWWS